MSAHAATTFIGKVVAVQDGDTISVMRDGRAERVRVHGIDAPEGGQDFGNRAKQFLSGLVFGKIVEIEVRDTDRYGRTVGRVMGDGRDAGLDMVRAGLAWHYVRYSSDALLSASTMKLASPAVDCGCSGGRSRPGVRRPLMQRVGYTLPISLAVVGDLEWCARQESNLRPLAPEANALSS